MGTKNNHRKMTMILLTIYMIVLTWIILFKFAFTFSDLPHLRGVNLIPFAESVIVNGKLEVSEIIQNVVAFIPFGLYLSMLKPNAPVWKHIIPIACVSLFYEVMQFILAIGATDITDLMANTFGGVIGCTFYLIFSKLLKEKTNKVLSVLAFIGTLGVILLLALLIVANL